MLNKWVVFDAMGVIFEEGDDLNKLLVPFIQKRNKKAERIVIIDLYRQAFVGKKTSREFWRELGLDKEYPAVEQEYLDSCLKLDPAFKALAEELSSEYNVAILSNDVK